MSPATSPDTRDESLIDMITAQLREGEAKLSTIPVVAQEIITKSQSPDCSLQDLEELVSRDQVIASKIVQMANSSFYRGLADADSLPQAIMRLGFNEVHNVTLAIAMKQVYQAQDGRFAEEMSRLWKASISSAVTARELAQAARYPRADEAFLGALVHDIGCVFIVESVERMGESDPRIANLPEPIFQELISVAHADVGATLLETLKFNEGICAAVRQHHDPAALEQDAKLAWILAAADLVVAKLGLDGTEPDADLSLSSREPFQDLGLDDLEIARVLVDLEDKAREMLGRLG